MNFPRRYRNALRVAGAGREWVGWAQCGCPGGCGGCGAHTLACVSVGGAVGLRGNAHVNMNTCVVRGRQRSRVVGDRPPGSQGRASSPSVQPSPCPTASPLVFAHGFCRAGTMSSSFRVSRVTVGQTEAGRGLSEEGLNID